MPYHPHAIRAFIGAKDYQESRQFYQQLGFTEIILNPSMSYFKVDENLGFYLQDYYVKEWIDNLMIFLEVDNLDECQKELMGKRLHEKYATIRFSGIKNDVWGRELFMHDRSGVLGHF